MEVIEHQRQNRGSARGAHRLSTAPINVNNWTGRSGIAQNVGMREKNTSVSSAKDPCSEIRSG